MKNKKNRLYSVWIIILLILFLIATFATETGKNSDFKEKLLILSALSFALTMYIRMYLIYKLEKFQIKHTYNSFIDFFNNRINDRLDLIFIIVPYLKRLDNRKLNIIRFQINFFTILTYLFALICIYFITIIKK